MNRTRTAALALTLALALPTSLAAPAAQGVGVAAPGGDFVGIDGATHPLAPGQVPGLRGQFFLGTDLDLACGVGGRGLASSMRSLTRLTRIIERSGRRVVWTVAPSKASVLSDRIDPATLPHGACDLEGLAEQRRVLDRRPDPAYLPVRRALVDDRRQTYYRTDIHWTTVGASDLTLALARRLDPAVARRQRFTYTTDSALGVVNAALGNPLVPEDAPAALPAGPVKVRTARGSTPWHDTSKITFDHAWDARPAAKAWPGRTVLLGDSFMFEALQTMRPVFAHGRFLWAEHAPRRVLLRAIKRADTVVIESLQTFVPLGQVVTDRGFRAEVRRTLRGPGTEATARSRPWPRSSRPCAPSSSW